MNNDILTRLNHIQKGLNNCAHVAHIERLFANLDKQLKQISYDISLLDIEIRKIKNAIHRR